MTDSAGAGGGEQRSWWLFLLPACFLVEIILGGPLGLYGGIPVRFILFGLSCGALVFGLLVRGRLTRAHLPALASVAGFLLISAVWVVVVPVITQGKFGFAISEARAFLALVLVVLLLALTPAGQLAELVRRLQRIAVWSAALLALFQVAVWLVGTLLPQLKWVIGPVLAALFGGASDFIYVGPMPDGFFRVFWISTLWVMVGLFWLPVVVPRGPRRTLLFAILVLGLFVSYSRGIWLGVAAGWAVSYVTGLERRHLVRSLARAGAAAVLVLVLLLGVLTATGQLERSTARITSTASGEDPSVGVRVEQARYLLALWHEHPFLGNGYGAYSPRYVRSTEAPFSYEHMAYAFLAKLGLAGMAACGAFVVFWILTAWRARHTDRKAAASFLGATAALMLASLTNPLIVNLVGMSILGCLLLQWASFAAPAPDRHDA
jgi:O-antigen ligase/polysaccharide polymerase Wzy-like membrane protein